MKSWSQKLCCSIKTMMTRWCVFELWLVHGVRQCTDKVDILVFFLKNGCYIGKIALFYSVFRYVSVLVPHLSRTLTISAPHSPLSQLSFFQLPNFIHQWMNQINALPLSLSLHHKYYTLYFPKVSLYYITLQIFLKNICWIYYYEYKVSVYIHLMKYVILTNKLEILQYLSYD